jgi:hypothetical protein
VAIRGDNGDKSRLLVSSGDKDYESSGDKDYVSSGDKDYVSSDDRGTRQPW